MKKPNAEYEMIRLILIFLLCLIIVYLADEFFDVLMAHADTYAPYHHSGDDVLDDQSWAMAKGGLLIVVIGGIAAWITRHW